MTELEFKSLALQGYNRIPLIAEAFADLETPLSLYLKLAHAKDGGKHSFLLESVVGGVVELHAREHDRLGLGCGGQGECRESERDSARRFQWNLRR